MVIRADLRNGDTNSPLPARPLTGLLPGGQQHEEADAIAGKQNEEDTDDDASANDKVEPGPRSAVEGGTERGAKPEGAISPYERSAAEHAVLPTAQISQRQSSLENSGKSFLKTKRKRRDGSTASSTNNRNLTPPRNLRRQLSHSSTPKRPAKAPKGRRSQSEEGYQGQDEVWDESWAIKCGHDLLDENEEATKLHKHKSILGQKPDKWFPPSEPKHLLDCWDRFLVNSPLNAGREASDIMQVAKAFFMSLGFSTPRSIVGTSEQKLDWMVEAMTNRVEWGFSPSNGFSIRQVAALSQCLNLANEIAKQGSQSVHGPDTTSWKDDDKPLELNNNTINVLKMLGSGPMTNTVMQAVNSVRMNPEQISEILRGAVFGDLSKLPFDFTPSTDVCSILLTENQAAAKNKRQPMSYIVLSEQAFLPEWVPPDAVGGIAHHIKPDMHLATDSEKKDALTMMNGLNKAFEKTRFFMKKEHWMLAWTRVLPLLLASRQWTFVEWMVHYDQICKLFELNQGQGGDYLIVYYEDRLRKELSDRCAKGNRINLAEACRKTNEQLMETCKAKLQAVLSAAGVQDGPTQAAGYRPKQDHSQPDPAASAIAKQQAVWDQKEKQNTRVLNALNQRNASFKRRVQTLQVSQPKKPYAANKFGKGWKGNNSKGEGKSQHQQLYSNQHHQHQGHQHAKGGKGKHKGNKWHKW